MKYLLIETSYEGCDYSIGCGVSVTELESTNEKDAIIHARNIVFEKIAGEEFVKYHDYGLDKKHERWELIHPEWWGEAYIPQSARIACVVDDIDIDEMKRELLGFYNTSKEESIKAKELEEYNRLKKKYGEQ